MEHCQVYHLFVQVEYIRQHSKAKEGKLLAIGHSMGGILLYAMLSRSGEALIMLFILAFMQPPVSFTFYPFCSEAHIKCVFLGVFN